MKEAQVNSPANGEVRIQTSSKPAPSIPPWFGEVAVAASHFRRQGILATINERVRFARRRFGHYDLIDFVIVLLGYAISGECTLETFYESLHPFSAPFMALFGRERLPHRSTLSRFLAALNQAAVEALRSVFLEDLVARPLERAEKPGGLWDRQGTRWLVFDVDGTRQAARQRALPCTPDLPPAQRRLDEVCAPGYTGRKRGETVRTRTTVLQAHTHQWLGTFSGASGAGNGDYRGELRQAVKAINAYLQAQSLQSGQAVVRLDGQYGNGAIVADLAGLTYVMRGKDYDLLELPHVQARLAQPPDQQITHPETGTCRALFDFPDLLLSPAGPRARVIVAARPAKDSPVKVGTTRGERVYEMFYTALPQTRSHLLMWSLCTCIVARLRPCSRMKTRSLTRIAGVRIPPGARSSGLSSHSGRGICAWNWATHCTQRPCARPNSRQPEALSRWQNQTVQLSQTSPTNRQSGRSRAWGASRVSTSLLNQTAPSSVLLVFPSIPRCVA